MVLVKSLVLRAKIGANVSMISTVKGLNIRLEFTYMNLVASPCPITGD